MNETVNPAKKLRGTIKDVPADKSIAHRSAMFAALSEGISEITNYPRSADPQSTLSCLKGLGIEIKQKDSKVIVHGAGRKYWKVLASEIDCGNSGTTMRLISGIIAGAGLNVTLTGDHSLVSRPMKRVINPLQEMGAKIQSNNGFAPLNFLESDKKLQAITYHLPMASAQVKSCILLAGLFAEGTTEIVESVPSRDHTERMLGLEKEYKNDGTIIIRSSHEHQIPTMSMNIPGDISGAAFWLVAGTIVPDSEIKLQNVGINPTRNAVIQILKRMGAQITVTVHENKGQLEPMADIIVKSSELKATQLEAREIPNCIDEIPILSVAMAFAKGTSTIRNAEELRTKETDRIAAISNLLTKAGSEHEVYQDGLSIKGDPGFIPKAAEFESFHDHRIAMSAAVMALKAKDASVILDADAASVSYPDFWKHLDQLHG